MISRYNFPSRMAFWECHSGLTFPFSWSHSNEFPPEELLKVEASTTTSRHANPPPFRESISFLQYCTLSSCSFYQFNLRSIHLIHSSPIIDHLFLTLTCRKKLKTQNLDYYANLFSSWNAFEGKGYDWMLWSLVTCWVFTFGYITLAWGWDEFFQ